MKKLGMLLGLLIFSFNGNAFEVTDLVGKWSGDFQQMSILVTYYADGTLDQEIPDMGFRASAKCQTTKIDELNFQFNCSSEGQTATVNAKFENIDRIFIQNEGEPIGVYLDRI